MDKMGTNEHELGLFIYKKFRDNLSEDFDILLDQRLKANRRADITISKGKTRLAIIEIKPRLYQRPDRKDTEDQVTNMAFYEGFRFAIIAVDENTLYIKVNQLQLELMLKERSVDLRLKRKNNIIQNSGIGTYRM